MFSITLTTFVVFFTSVKPAIYVYDTQDGQSIEFYDCVMIQSLPYCRRPITPITLKRDDDTISCENNRGKLHRFSDLHAKQVKINTTLHQWQVGLEQVERYSRYLSDPDHQADEYICECANQNFFGKHCEYQMSEGESFDDLLTWQQLLRQFNERETRLWRSIICYRTLKCNSGLLCLDWREICDGVQQCMNGFDEYNCDLLELNQCADDEYRCQNGMCIPDEYFLDGDLDCLDWSDELQYQKDDVCYDQNIPIWCDDRVCPLHSWSCGDGQCIKDRFGFRKGPEYETCASQRDQSFMCETHHQLNMWTRSYGQCDESEDFAEEFSLENCTLAEKCEYFLKCTLSRGIDRGCLCKGESACYQRLLQDCSLDLIQYPVGSIIGSHVSFFYSRSRQRFSKLPDWIQINGTIQCLGIPVMMMHRIPFDVSLLDHRIIDEIFCGMKMNTSISSKPTIVDQCQHGNGSTDICNEWNTCLSNTRINDGFRNCLNGMDELVEDNIDRTCASVRRHRFHCATDQPTCLSVTVLGDQYSHCHNKFDEQWLGIGQKLIDMKCSAERKEDCALLRQYIDQSWRATNENQTRTDIHIPFHAHCDTFWNMGSKQDENVTECRGRWICTDDQWQCHTGQCIDRAWIDDFEWDCTDASDEYGLFFRDFQRLQENERLAMLDHHSELLFSICNLTYPIPCLPLDPIHPGTCLRLDQLGNNEVDCLGAIDERNTFEHCDEPSMLGHYFKCLSTNTCIPFWLHCQSDQYRCPNPKDDVQWCSRQKQLSNCSSFDAFTCFDGTCSERGRCEENLDCAFTEDEYMCDHMSSRRKKFIRYRSVKENHFAQKSHTIRLPRLPPDANMTDVNADQIEIPDRIRPEIVPRSRSNDDLEVLSAIKCNRGIGTFSLNGSIACFCPPQYYGDYCEFHADRLSVLLHLNFTNSVYTTRSDPTIVLKLLVLFMFDNQTLMAHEFHVRPAIDFNLISKKMAYFLYSRSDFFLEHRRQRHFDRSQLINSHPYSIRIELYERSHLEQPVFLGVWQYPVIFDQLPVYRFAKVLRLPKFSFEKSNNPCVSNPCRGRGECYPLINDRSKYLCLCPANFTGPNCAIADPQCASGYCSPTALCKANYRHLLRGKTNPYCVCSFDRYGDRCDILRDRCVSNRCFNGGICVPRSTPQQVACLCPDRFFGPRCEWKKTNIRLSLQSDMDYNGVVIQYFDIDFYLLKIILVHQAVYRSLPSLIEYQHHKEKVPAMTVAKLYTSHTQTSADIHLLSSHLDVVSIDGTVQISEQNRCHHINVLSEGLSPVRYHRFCIEHSTLVCFRDDFYLCICSENHTRVECFNYDQTLDRCSHCLAGGRCLKGQPNQINDFLCTCPTCYYGRYCQFSTKSFTFTLDQLFYTDLTSHQKHHHVNLIILGTLFAFIAAMPNNLFSFVTFRRKACLHSGIGYYLLCVSMINQISVGLLMARLIHLSIIIAFPRSFSMIDNILCKLLSYLLTSTTRITYWFVAFIALERVYTTVFLSGRWFKQPHIARRLMASTVLLTFVSGAYELFFIRLFTEDEDEETSMCVIEFPLMQQSIWILVHQIVSMIHFILPIVINLCCTFTIIFIVIKKKMNIGMAGKHQEATPSRKHSRGRTVREKRDRFNVLRDVLTEHKEMIARPMITLIPSFFSLFSLPIFIISFSLGCRNLETSSLRYLLMVFYFLSFIPQLLTFLLYILPSTFHSKEWHSTLIARRITALREQFVSIYVINRSMTTMGHQP